LTLTGNLDTDTDRLRRLLAELREQLPQMPEDPYLLYAQAVHSSEMVAKNALPKPQEVLTEILAAAQSYDFVGIYAGGGIFTGFANSFGQRNWHSSYSFNLDFSFYHEKDKAVKSAYAGFQWDPQAFQDQMTVAKTQFEILKRPSHTIAPGCYRVYLSPSALHEILNLLGWGGFSLKSQRTKDSVLRRMLEAPVQTLHPSVTLLENTAQGIAPAFQTKGFLRPDQVTLIEQGRYHSPLVSPRSAKEYGVPTNGANDEESPVSLDLAAGALPMAEVLKTLDKGIYINNLWYLNYSDRAACRMTGMTRFATFWVEGGEIVAPLSVMRFDETLYSLLGDNLIGLTSEREFIMEPDTYEVRSAISARVPGALVEAFTLTL
jgi:predicted Zn-dependent protease